MAKLKHNLFFFLLFITIGFPQERNLSEMMLQKLTPKELFERHQSNLEVVHNLDDNNSLLSKSKSGDWRSLLQNQQKEFYNEVYNEKDSRTLISNTLLDNGYLLLEIIHQLWDGVNWVNHRQIQYIYDANNLLIEELTQKYQNSTGWENYTLNLYTYNVNKPELAAQGMASVLARVILAQAVQDRAVLGPLVLELVKHRVTVVAPVE